MWQRIRSLFKASDPNGYKRWQCLACSYIYDEAKGWPEYGVMPCTRWDDIPEDWLCPDCGAAKSDFEMTRIG